MASSNSKRVKVLISGPINGQLSLLSNKLSTLNNSKAGPFDICVCCGPFFYSSTATSIISSAALTNTKVAGDEETANNNNKVDSETKSNIEAAANNDVTKLKEGTIKFDIPVLFVDVGDSLPNGLEVHYPKVIDDAEIDLDDDDDDDEDVKKEKGEVDNLEEENKVPDGLLRIAPNLYQLIGSSPNNIADIISVPLPLKDPTNTTTSNKREHPTALTIGYLPKNTRLSTQTQSNNNNFTTKSKHTSFLGCDILISTEWGQGMCDLKVGALSIDDRTLLNGSGEGSAGGQGIEIGSYDVAELVAMSRPRYHIAPGPIVPVQQPQQKQQDDENNDTTPPQIKLHQRFMASLPYRYPPTSSTSGSTTSSSSSSHAGRFLAMGSIQPPPISKSLGKSFKYIHAVGIVPLAYMDSNDRENAKELDKVVDCPYTDASYGVDINNVGGRGGVGNMMNYGGGMNGGGGMVGGLSEARARRLAQEDAASNMNSGGGQGPGGAFRWQQRGRKRPLNGEDGPGSGIMNEEEAKRQAIEASNPDNTSLFLHGLHRDPSGMTLTNDAIMNSFKPFGCIGIRFPKPKMNHHHRQQSHYQNSEQQRPSYAFLDFNTHEEAHQCLADLNGEVAVCNVMLTLKWSSSGKSRQQPQMMHHQGQQQGNNMGMMPQRRQRNRLTEQEAGDSTTLFLRLPTSINSSDYPTELETMRLLGQGTMEDELNVGVPLDSPDRITAKDEPALRVTVRQPTAETNYGFLEFASHTAALTTIVALTGNDDGGRVSEDKLTASCLITDDMKKKDISHLSGVTLYWAKGSSQPKSGAGGGNNYGLKFNKQHFPPDSRTDCWFCLASPACEKHLIVAVYEECYVALPKGGVNEHHALIVPVEHGGDGALVNRKLSPEIESVKSKLRLHARTVLNKDLFVFERCIATKGGYHTHVQCIPVDANSGPTIQSKMLDMASRVGFQLKEITSDLGLNALEDDWSDGYFYAEIPLPGGGDEFRRFIYRAGGEDSGGADNYNGVRRGPTVPLQFGREVLAEVMDNPDIGQWKACVVSKEKEEELTIAFRKSLSSVSS